MPVRSRVIALALFGLILAAFTAYWFHVAGELRKGIDGFVAQKRAEGWRVAMDSVRVNGFPLTVSARLEGVDLRHPAGLSWHGEMVSVSIPLLNPLTISVSLPGMHLLGGFGQSAILSAAKADLDLRLDTEGGLAGLVFTGGTLALEQPGVAPLTLAEIKLVYDRLNPPDPSHEHPSAGMTLALHDLDLPDIAGLPLARRVESLQVEARVMGTIAGGPPLAALAAWSHDGGTVELDRIALDWAPLSLEADGTMALDPNLQPLIATSARLRGFGELVARLVQAGLVEPGMASAAQIMLGILARPDAQGRPTLTIPVTLQDGILTAGQVRVMRVPPLPLPSPQPGASSP